MEMIKSNYQSQLNLKSKLCFDIKPFHSWGRHTFHEVFCNRSNKNNEAKRNIIIIMTSL